MTLSLDATRPGERVRHSRYLNGKVVSVGHAPGLLLVHFDWQPKGWVKSIKRASLIPLREVHNG